MSTTSTAPTTVVTLAPGLELVARDADVADRFDTFIEVTRSKFDRAARVDEIKRAIERWRDQGDIDSIDRAIAPLGWADNLTHRPIEETARLAMVLVEHESIERIVMCAEEVDFLTTRQAALENAKQDTPHRADDPRVKQVLAAFDRHVDSPIADALLLCSFMCNVVETQNGRFTHPAEAWSIDAIRAILVAYTTHAPEAALDIMAEVAAHDVAALERAELELAYEDATGAACPWRGKEPPADARAIIARARGAA